MAMKQVEGTGGFLHHYPRLAVIVTCHAAGKDNAMAVAWHSSVSFKPPLIGVSITSKRFTYELIMESKEFAINFLPLQKAELIAATGGISGRDTDKFEKFDMAREKPILTSSPILADAYAAYECKLADHHTYGDHEWLVGEVVATHYREEAFTEARVLDLEKVSPALFYGAELYTTSDGNVIRHLKRGRYGKGLR